MRFHDGKVGPLSLLSLVCTPAPHSSDPVCGAPLLRRFTDGGGQPCRKPRTASVSLESLSFLSYILPALRLKHIHSRKKQREKIAREWLVSDRPVEIFQQEVFLGYPGHEPPFSSVSLDRQQSTIALFACSVRGVPEQSLARRKSQGGNHRNHRKLCRKLNSGFTPLESVASVASTIAAALHANLCLAEASGGWGSICFLCLLSAAFSPCW